MRQDLALQKIQLESIIEDPKEEDKGNTKSNNKNINNSSSDNNDTSDMLSKDVKTPLPTSSSFTTSNQDKSTMRGNISENKNSFTNTMIEELKKFDYRKCSCYDPNEESKLVEIISSVGKDRFNQRIMALGNALQSR
jgi:hypothetical protein